MLWLRVGGYILVNISIYFKLSVNVNQYVTGPQAHIHTEETNAFCHVCMDYRLKRVKKSHLDSRPAPPFSSARSLSLALSLSLCVNLPVPSKTQDSERLLFHWPPPLGSPDWGRTQSNWGPPGTTNQKSTLHCKKRKADFYFYTFLYYSFQRHF